MLEQFNDLISTICTNSSIVQEVRKDRYFLQMMGAYTIRSGSLEDITSLLQQNVYPMVVHTCGHATQLSQSMS